MKLKRKLLFIKKCIISSLLIFLVVGSSSLEAYAFSNQVIQRGATGDDVIELQARLQYIGYYTGKIDGVFGWHTYWALRNFQHDFGLDVDGLAGDAVKKKLREHTYFDKQYVHGKIERGERFNTYGKTGKGPSPSVPPPGQRNPVKGQQTTPAKPSAPPPAQLEKSVNIPSGFSENDITLLARAVHSEARGEPYEGQVAVAAIILNRVKSSEFPNTISGVIFEPLAFSAVADGQFWLEPNETSRRAALDAINGWDPTGGLVYYFNPATATSAWMFSRPQVKRIGKHVFVK